MYKGLKINDYFINNKKFPKNLKFLLIHHFLLNFPLNILDYIFFTFLIIDLIFSLIMLLLLIYSSFLCDKKILFNVVNCDEFILKNREDFLLFITLLDI